MGNTLAAGLFALALAVPAPTWAGSALVRAVDSVGITVSDMDRSVHFFADVLGFEPVSDAEVAAPDRGGAMRVTNGRAG